MEKHPDKIIMLVAEKGTMGVGSSRMSGVNNVGATTSNIWLNMNQCCKKWIYHLQLKQMLA